ncbi:MAG TPA: PEP-CTERM sorting domain-containing protein [Methyloversatilis sp.]
MFNTKLLAAALALGLSGMASASITGGSTGNTEFVFSAFDSSAGKGYTFDLADLGFDSIFGSNVRMNSLIGSTQTASTISTTLVATPANKIVFDYALPSFDTFAAGVNLNNLKWNLVSAETSGIFRIVQTVTTAPAAKLTNTAIITAANKFDQYTGAVNGKGTNVGGVVTDDGFAMTVAADGAAYAGNLGSSLGGTGYSSTGGLNDRLGLYVVSSTTTTSSTTAGRFAALQNAAGQEVKARIYSAADGYHLQVAVVPEPETYAMLLAGLGLLGFVARRNRRA